MIGLTQLLSNLVVTRLNVLACFWFGLKTLIHSSQSYHLPSSLIQCNKRINTHQIHLKFHKYNNKLSSKTDKITTRKCLCVCMVNRHCASVYNILKEVFKIDDQYCTFPSQFFINNVKHWCLLPKSLCSLSRFGFLLLSFSVKSLFNF